MEEKIIPLKVRLKHMVGIRFDLVNHNWKGVTITRGWYVFIGFYWFCFAFLRKWPLALQHGYATGFIFSYKPSPRMREGNLMWLNNKKYLRFDHPEDLYHAA